MATSLNGVTATGAGTTVTVNYRNGILPEIRASIRGATGVYTINIEGSVDGGTNWIVLGNITNASTFQSTTITRPLPSMRLNVATYGAGTIYGDIY